MKQVLTGLLLVGLGASARAAVDFSRYAVILEREPFGLAEVEQAAGEAAPEPPAIPPFVKDLRMCAITEDAVGIQVGFIDIKQKKNYFMGVGDPPQDGISVVDADYDNVQALLRKDGMEHWISMDGPLQPGGENGAAGPPAVASLAPRGNGPEAASAPRGRTSYADRLRARREAMLKRQQERSEARPKLQGEELKQYLEKYQMDLIREGKPPLPIPLTPEMDKALVEEGVLPPLEQEPPPTL